MATKIIESLIAWAKAVQPKQQAQDRADNLLKWCPQLPTKMRQRLRAGPDESWNEQAAPSWGRKGAKVGVGTSLAKLKAPRAVAACLLVSFAGDEAECKVSLDGFELESVGMPAQVLRAHKLQPGDRFTWALRDNGQITQADIEVCHSPAAVDAEMSEAEQSELAELLADSRRREAEGEEWDEYTGDGR